jgi:hypothetical protein
MMNLSLLCKWWWLLENEDGLWQEIVRKKYVRNFPICLIPYRMSDSPLWKDMLKVRHIYLQGREYIIGNGRLNDLTLSEEKDKVTWRWTHNKKNSVSSVYRFLSRDECGASYARIWKAKIPEKIKICMWLIDQNAILTKDNMIKKKWVGDPGCYFCGIDETIDHLMFECPIARVVWGGHTKIIESILEVDSKSLAGW